MSLSIDDTAGVTVARADRSGVAPDDGSILSPSIDKTTVDCEDYADAQLSLPPPLLVVKPLLVSAVTRTTFLLPLEQVASTDIGSFLSLWTDQTTVVVAARDGRLDAHLVMPPPVVSDSDISSFSLFLATTVRGAVTILTEPLLMSLHWLRSATQD